ncbi:MAG: indolepyruvate ferredoxin oxidoreductase subunit alpha [bacterium]
MREFLSGNEAIARGAYDAGVTVASAYPGTPSTEILENFSEYEGVYSEWSTNEKVALEMGIGASLVGARVLVAMKHVGLNVASDPLMTASYTGVKGGLVVVSADDPGMHSSQNEQDNRHYARMAKIPMLEPSDSQEAYDFVRLALDLSEEYDTPVLLRITTRIAHSKGIVHLRERVNLERRFAFERNPAKYVMIPAFARKRHSFVEERQERLRKLSETTPLNFIEMNDPSVGIISSGAAYQYAREVLPSASFLKLGMTNPLPDGLIRDFAGRVEKIYVVEELDPFIEDRVRALGVPATGKKRFSILGELSPEAVRAGLLGIEAPNPGDAPADGIPARPPVLCPGCPHRGVFYTLHRLKALVLGDIGCYTLGVLPPLSAMDTCICMGASIGAAHGAEKALKVGGDGSSREKKKIVAVIGDSTFAHSGIAGLVNMVYNKSCGTVIILDNGTTAMTGCQENPSTERTLQGEATTPLDFVGLAKALGVRRVRVVDPYDLELLKEVISREIEAQELSVIVASRPCMLIDRSEKVSLKVDPEACTGCMACLRVACPAIRKVDRSRIPESSKDKVEIDPLLCTGCEVCAQVCKFDAIGRPR